MLTVDKTINSTEQNESINNISSSNNQSPKILSKISTGSDLAIKIQVVKYFHEYIRRTGDCSVYAPLFAYLEGKEDSQLLLNNNNTVKLENGKDEVKVEPAKEIKIVSSSESDIKSSEIIEIHSSTNGSYTEEKLSQDTAKVLEEVRKEVSQNCILIRDNIVTISQCFLTNSKSSSLDLSIKSADYEQLKISNETLKEQLYRLSKNIYYLVELARQYTPNTEQKNHLGSNNGLELHSMDEPTMIFKLSRDLLYFLRYIQNQAITNKIKQNFFYSFNPNDSLERLNYYLDILPEAGNNLVNALQSRLAKNIDTTSKNKSDLIEQADEDSVKTN